MWDNQLAAIIIIISVSGSLTVQPLRLRLRELNVSIAQQQVDEDDFLLFGLWLKAQKGLGDTPSPQALSVWKGSHCVWTDLHSGISVCDDAIKVCVCARQVRVTFKPLKKKKNVYKKWFILNDL